LPLGAAAKAPRLTRSVRPTRPPGATLSVARVPTGGAAAAAASAAAAAAAAATSACCWAASALSGLGLV